MMPRRINLSYSKVMIPELKSWLVNNDIEFKLKFTNKDSNEFGVEVYSAKEETAIRIKWGGL